MGKFRIVSATTMGLISILGLPATVPVTLATGVVVGIAMETIPDEYLKSIHKKSIYDISKDLYTNLMNEKKDLI